MIAPKNDEGSGISDRHSTLSSSFREEDKNIWHMGFLFRYYKSEFMYFEVFDAMRRILMACLLGFVGNSATRATIGIMFSGMSIIIQREVMPFVNDDHNFMAVWSQWQIAITLFLSLLLVSLPFGFSAFAVGIALTVVNCGLILLAYLHHSGMMLQMRKVRACQNSQLRDASFGDSPISAKHARFLPRRLPTRCPPPATDVPLRAGVRAAAVRRAQHLLEGDRGDAEKRGRTR